METRKESLGILGIDSVHFYVHDIGRARKLYVDVMDFAETGRSSPELEEAGRQRSVVFEAGNIRLVVSQPIGIGGRAYRWLQKYPEGVGSITFRVADVEKTFRLLEERGGTPISDIQRFDDGKGGKLAFFSITTPFGDTTFRFLQRDGYDLLYPGMVRYPEPRGGENRHGFGEIDHVTSNFRTMKPALLWMEHVLGLERFWDVEFHTQDVSQVTGHQGSGLRSIVMWDPESGLRFANNEPLRPHFKASQINVFIEDQHGEGVQHLALTVQDIISAVRGLRAAGADFMPTPGTYYDVLPERIRRMGINQIDEDVDVLRELEILVDGDKDHSYLLQIFMKEGASLFKDVRGGPFFFEIIQRKGDLGFGAGNFRALFESIERQQIAEGRV